MPARWLVVAVAIVRHFFGRKRISKLGIAALVWSVTPRSLKVAVAGFAGVATIVFLGAIASITLLVLQLT